MRVLDEKHRLFGLINPIDALVALAAIVAAVAVAGALFTDFAEVDEAEPVRFQFVCGGVEGFDPAWIAAGDTISIPGAAVIGNVVSVETTPTLVELIGPDGEAAIVPSGIKQNVSITVEGRAVRDGYTYVFSGVRIINKYTYRIEAGAFGWEAAEARGLEPKR